MNLKSFLFFFLKGENLSCHSWKSKNKIYRSTKKLLKKSITVEYRLKDALHISYQEKLFTWKSVGLLLACLRHLWCCRFLTSLSSAKQMLDFKFRAWRQIIRRPWPFVAADGNHRGNSLRLGPSESGIFCWVPASDNPKADAMGFCLGCHNAYSLDHIMRQIC